MPEERHPTIQKLQKRKERHQQRPAVVRWAVVLLGVLITLAGVVMTGPVPGPGFLVIPIGLALLALQFEWAENLLEKAVVWANDARAKAANRSKGEKIASGIGISAALAAFVTAAMTSAICASSGSGLSMRASTCWRADAPIRGSAEMSGKVTLCSRRSDPVGLPVTLGSPT